MVGPQGRREQCAYACRRGIAKQRACGLIGIARSTLVYELRQPAKDAPVIAAMKRLSAQYPRYGYRRIRIFLRRERLAMSASRTERLWRKAGLQPPRRRPRRRIASSRPRPLPPRAANHVWAYDFVRGVAQALQRRPSAPKPGLLDPERVQTAPSDCVVPSTPSRFPGIKRSKIPRQVNVVALSRLSPLAYVVPGRFISPNGTTGLRAGQSR